MQICYAVVAFGISTREAITWRRLAVPAVTFIISPEVNIKSLENNSTVPFAPTALSLYTLNTSLPFVMVRVIVSALSLSSDTSTDSITESIRGGQV